MKRLYIIMASAAAAALCLWQCSFKEDEPLSFTAPQVNFITEDEVISAKVGEPVTIKTKTVSGDHLTKSWYVDGVLTCASDNFTYTFETPGTYTVKYVVFNGAGSEEKEYTVNVSDVLEMHLSVGDSTAITRKELTTLQLYAIVDKGSEVTHSWTVDGEKVCDGAYFGSYYLSNPNVKHTVVYKGKNSVGEFTQTIEVSVVEQPLEISFQNNSVVLPYYEYNGSELRFTIDKTAYRIKFEANVLHGGTGAVHKWYVDGKLAAENEKLNQLVEQTGTYTVDYVCTNARGEKVEKSWDIVYDGNAEADPADLFQLHNANASYLAKESLAVVDSPYDGDGHGKVLKWHNDSNNKTRGGIILRNEYFAENGIDISQFKGIKFSGRLAGGEGSTLSETAARSPCVAYQEDYSKEYSSVSTIKMGTGDAGIERTPWNYICKPIWVGLTYSVDFSGEGMLKIYPVCTVNKTTVVSGYFAIVYIDDIVLFK